MTPEYVQYKRQNNTRAFELVNSLPNIADIASVMAGVNICFPDSFERLESIYPGKYTFWWIPEKEDRNGEEYAIALDWLQSVGFTKGKEPDGVMDCAAYLTIGEPGLEQQVIDRAKLDANEFVQEFGEPLDSAETDWDATAWEVAQSDFKAHGIELTSEQCNALWHIYSKSLEEETERLCE